MLLNAENYRQGFLVDEELMGGITEVTDPPGHFAAFVLRHTTGEYLGYEVYPALTHALSAIAAVKREWKFESTSGCGACGEGNCSKAQGGGCKKLGAKSNEPMPCEAGACAPEINP